MRLLVFGSRTWDDRSIVRAILNGISWEVTSDSEDEPLVILEGGAPGADRIASEWADEDPDSEPGVQHERYEADWDRLGRAAGPARNQEAVDRGKPDRAVGFVAGLLPDGRPNSPGSKDMFERLLKAGIPTYLVLRSRP